MHANNTDSCNDGNLCTTGDVCAGGTCGGTPVSCPVGQTCNPGTGTCQSGPVTVTFQQGAAGYLGSADTFIDAALGSQATVTPIVIDGSPVEQALLKFDGIFGAGAGQIPAGSTITSATLTLWVGTDTSDESANLVNFHRLLHCLDRHRRLGGLRRGAVERSGRHPERRRGRVGGHVAATTTMSDAGDRVSGRRHDEPPGVVGCPLEQLRVGDPPACGGHRRASLGVRRIDDREQHAPAST